MEQTTENSQYELGYHLTPDLEDAQVGEEGGKMGELITNNGGAIATSATPKRIHLSYPIDHKHYAYFGIINFTGPSEIVNSINNQLKLEPKVLRYLVLKQDTGKEVRTLGDVRRSPSRQSMTRTHTPVPTQETAPVPEQSPEQEEKMKKEIEGVLEKI